MTVASSTLLRFQLQIHRTEFPPQYPSITLTYMHTIDVAAEKLVYQGRLKVRVYAIENTHYSLISTLKPTYGELSSYSYRFESPDRTFVFAGDTGPSDAIRRHCSRS